MQSTPSLPSLSRSTQTWSGSTLQGPIYVSNRTIWHLNSVQTNDLSKTELFEIDHSTVSKQCQIELLVIVVLSIAIYVQTNS